MTQGLFIDWRQTQFSSKNNQLRRKTNYDVPIILIVDGHATHVAPGALANAGSQRIILIHLVVHSSQISQPLDECVFGVFKMLNRRETKTQRMNGETLKLDGDILAF
jgi:hypothetical protein